ncbi:MAG TPA: lysine--tRNA ligase [Patescibacteria group bacterium]|jgi:lysyl-tRNA synthetase class 1
MATIQAKHWTDKVVQDILKWQAKQPGQLELHVDDMKTPSGRVHTGSLRGVILHDALAQVLAASTNQSVVSTYVFNDMDPMDGLPGYLDQAEYIPHMGKPLYRIPAPPLDQSGLNLELVTPEERQRFAAAKTFGEFYALDFIDGFRKLGCTQEIVWSHELYESGQMDEVIRASLDNVEQIKKIYKQIADYDLPEKWYPFQVICSQCGKVGTTLVTDWNGSEVTYECQPSKVEWAKGCGHSGKISPFGGTGKLLWKVDWPAHWAVMGVTVEGAGKDHTSAGGSRDMGKAIVEKVFNWPDPFDIPYEWILVRGAKMSSSKGIGTSAREFVRLFPAELGRFLFLNKHYNQVIDFDPTLMAIPDLFDEYDQAARIFWGQEEGDNRLGRAFELSQVTGQVPSAHFLPRFRDVAIWMQHPELDLNEEFSKIKGSALTKVEKNLLEERRQYAAVWIAQYASTEFQLTFKPEKILAVELTGAEQKYLAAVDELVASKTWQADQLQQALFDLAKGTLGTKQGFQAIYKAFLGKKAGPRAAWFLLNIPTSERQHRFAQLIGKK